jgi:hypothetical protein
VTVVLVALIIWLIADGARLKRRLAELEAQGVGRRSRSSDD